MSGSVTNNHLPHLPVRRFRRGPFVMPPRTFDYPSFPRPKAPSAPIRPPPMRFRIPFVADPVIMRQSLCVYAPPQCDMEENRIAILRYPPRRDVWGMTKIWVSYQLCGCLYIQRDGALGMVIISYMPEYIRDVSDFPGAPWRN